MNRYTNITPSSYTPQTMEELAFVPLLKRKKHDDILAQQELVRSGLAKVDPLDVHFDEAMRLKQGIESKLDQTASELATNGFNNDMIGKTIALNREYQDLVSPTGRIGQINTAKQVEAAERKNFMESAEKQGIGSSRAVDLWKDHLSKYKGYDDRGRVRNIDPRGVAAKQDYETDLLQYHSILGKTTESMKASGYHFEDGPNGTVMVDKKGNLVTTDNFKQLQDAQKGFEAKWINPNGEGYKYSQDAGLNITPEKVKNDFRAMRESSSIDNRYNDVQFIRDPKAKGPDEMTPAAVVGTPIDVKEIGVKKEDFAEIDKIGTTPNVSMSSALANSRTGLQGRNTAYNPSQVDKFKSSEISDPYLRKRYEATFDRLKANGTIPKNANKDSADIAKIVKSRLQNDGPVTLSSNVIVTDNELNSLGFPGTKIGKDSKERTLSVVRDLQAGTRKFIDPKDGKSKTWNEMIEAGYKPSTTQYYGYMSPHSWKDTKFGAKEQNVSQHLVTMSDEDGNLITTEISRTKNDGNSNDILASNDLRKTYQAATIEPNELVDFKSTNAKMKGVKVAYITKDKNGQVLQEPVFLVQKGNKQQVMTEPDYMATVYALYKQ